MFKTAVKQYQEETDAGITTPTSSGWESKKEDQKGTKEQNSFLLSEIKILFYIYSMKDMRKKIIDGDT